MHLGLVTPIVNLNPRFDIAEWELSGDVEDIVSVAQGAESLGYSWLGCPEHVAIPVEVASTRGGRYWDPVATLSFVAARTTTIKLLSHVAVLGYHHPLEVVKRYGTLDEASGGRVILGVGVGSLQSEFELLGASFDNRGEIADDSLRAIRASFGKRQPEYQGSHFTVSGFIVEPCGLQSHVPIWVGGRSRRSLRRGIDLGDGWIPFGLTLNDLEPILSDHAVRAHIAGRERPFEIVLAPEPPLDPLGDSTMVADVVRRYKDLGATGLALRFVHSSRSHYIDQLGAMAELVQRTVGLDRPESSLPSANGRA
jgi:probable F420-dependent oxidoreductase